MADPKTAAEAGKEIDRIRDIVFGPQMREYEQRFQAVQRDLGRLQEELDRLTAQLADQDSHQTKKLQGLRDEMRRADDDLRAELRETTRQLAADKVDRVTLGDLFIELGNQLKNGGKLGDLLSALDEPSEQHSP
ncbi:MAG: hypothetical protein D6784_12415 [Chloroflexi bacterium]|nr:MAG: hypothetical protein D6784_12415 [Chloroflexota bacterium]